MKMKLTDHIRRNVLLRLVFPFFTWEITLEDLMDSKQVDERIARLGQIKAELESAVLAVDSLRIDAQNVKSEADALKSSVDQLKQDRATAETMLKVPEESFARVLAKASSKGRVRGVIEGSIIGFITGLASSLLVTWLTK